jgi:hypothetical protein
MTLNLDISKDALIAAPPLSKECDLLQSEKNCTKGREEVATPRPLSSMSRIL